MRARDFSKMYAANDGTRTLLESIVVPEVQQTLHDWQKSGAGGVLIGGLALSYYTKPRYTQDVDILFSSEANVPSKVAGFKKTRPHSFQNNRTHVEVEVLTPDHTGLPLAVVNRVIATAEDSEGFKIASAAGLVASKLFRLNARDRADIIDLVKSANLSSDDLIAFSLGEEQLAAFQRLKSEAATDPE